ncbi:hypothetical protein K2X89_04435 [Myxococcota bacterium]|nr:hypothetical protein [Myxococcota bacterium]
MSNPTGVTIYGVGAGIQGWDNSVLIFQSAELNAGPYFCATSSCRFELYNSLSLSSSADPGTGNFFAGPSDVQNIAGVGTYLPLVSAISTRGQAGNGARDPGLDGLVDGGDAQFRLKFMIGAPGTTTVTIGTSTNPTLGNVVALAGGASEQAQNAFIVKLGDSLVLIPEPDIGLLLGFGLTVLATGKRHFSPYSRTRAMGSCAIGSGEAPRTS